jgi:thioredoxin 1
MSALAHITTDQFKSAVLDSSQPVLVDFYADWCGPCQAMAPILERLAGELGNRVKIVKVNVDEEPDLAARFGIMSIPTLILFRGGVIVKQIVGLMRGEQLRSLLDQYAPAVQPA